MKNWRNVPALGVGIVYMPGLADAIAAAGDTIDFIEVEPQQHWLHSTGAESDFRCDRDEFARIRQLGKPCVLHSVGCPVGGSLSLLPEQAPALRASIAALDPVWVSEHLSFNEFGDSTSRDHAGFLLPPLPMYESVAVAARNLRAFSDGTGLPIAFETGVNYLQPLPGEWPDGAFIAAVAEAADCAILLDLHNVWTNARNGRQSVEAFIDMLPLERVTELHLAGGEMLDGYWLDAHSGLTPQTLMTLARQIVPRLPNLKAITFEMMDEALSSGACDAHGLHQHLLALRELWTLRGTWAKPAVESWQKHAGASPGPGIAVHTWEQVVGALAVGAVTGHPLATMLARDPGIAILRKLVEAVRAGTVIDTLRLSSRLIAIVRGRAFLVQTLEDYWRHYTPLAFATDESIRFAHFVGGLDLDIPGLDDMLALETASCKALADGTRQDIILSQDPFAIVEAIEQNRQPAVPQQRTRVALEISPA